MFAGTPLHIAIRCLEEHNSIENATQFHRKRNAITAEPTGFVRLYINEEMSLYK